MAGEYGLRSYVTFNFVNSCRKRQRVGFVNTDPGQNTLRFKSQFSACPFENIVGKGENFSYSYPIKDRNNHFSDI